MILLYSRQYPIKILQDGGFCGPVHGEPSDNRAFGTSPVVTSKRFATSPPGAAEDHSLGKVVASSWTCDRWQRTFAESSVTRGWQGRPQGSIHGAGVSTSDVNIGL